MHPDGHLLLVGEYGAVEDVDVQMIHGVAQAEDLDTALVDILLPALRVAKSNDGRYAVIYGVLELPDLMPLGLLRHLFIYVFGHSDNDFGLAIGFGLHHTCGDVEPHHLPLGLRAQPQPQLETFCLSGGDIAIGVGQAGVVVAMREQLVGGELKASIGHKYVSLVGLDIPLPCVEASGLAGQPGQNELMTHLAVGVGLRHKDGERVGEELDALFLLQRPPTGRGRAAGDEASREARPQGADRARHDLLTAGGPDALDLGGVGLGQLVKIVNHVDPERPHHLLHDVRHGPCPGLKKVAPLGRGETARIGYTQKLGWPPRDLPRRGYDIGRKVDSESPQHVGHKIVDRHLRLVLKRRIGEDLIIKNGDRGGICVSARAQRHTASRSVNNGRAHGMVDSIGVIVARKADNAQHAVSPIDAENGAPLLLSGIGLAIEDANGLPVYKQDKSLEAESILFQPEKFSKIVADLKLLLGRSIPPKDTALCQPLIYPTRQRHLLSVWPIALHWIIAKLQKQTLKTNSPSIRRGEPHHIGQRDGHVCIARGLEGIDEWRHKGHRASPHGPRR